jgi:arginase family enzyme
MFPPELLEKLHVAVPALRVEETADEVVISNDVIGTRYQGPREVLGLLELFRTPRPLKDALDSKVDPQQTAMLVMNALIMDIDALVLPVQPSIGARTRISDYLRREKAPDLVLFGATIDSAATGRAGCRHGPTEIRAATSLPFLSGRADEMANPFQLELAAGPMAYLDLEMRRRYRDAMPDIVDVGDLRIMPGESINTYGARIKMLASLILARNGKPAMLGGDHSTTWFVLDALLSRGEPLGVIHFDAHHDLWPTLAPHLKYVTHGNPFAHALQSPSLKVLHQLGLRVFDPVHAELLQADPRVSYLSARELSRMEPAAVFANLPRDLPYYLTFDVDCLDPSIAPETGTPAPGGLGYYQALDLVDYAARNFRLIGWDIVEVGQREERVNRAALVAARLIQQRVLAGVPFDPLETYFRQS